MPSLKSRESELDSGNLYTTEYAAVWANFPLEAEDKDVKAYQLASHVLEMLGINNGTLTKFHQMNAWSGAYETELRTLQYDMLYGDRVVYGGKNPFEETDMRFGTRTWAVTARGGPRRYAGLPTARISRRTARSTSTARGMKTTSVSEKQDHLHGGRSAGGRARVSVRQVAEDGTEPERRRPGRKRIKNKAAQMDAPIFVSKKPQKVIRRYPCRTGGKTGRQNRSARLQTAAVAVHKQNALLRRGGFLPRRRRGAYLAKKGWLLCTGLPFGRLCAEPRPL